MANVSWTVLPPIVYFPIITTIQIILQGNAYLNAEKGVLRTLVCSMVSTAFAVTPDLQTYGVWTLRNATGHAKATRLKSVGA